MKCPGQDSRYWDEAAIFESKCPECGKEVEFFKDDSTRNCKECGHRMLNPRIDFGCASYCPYAEQCLGSLPPELAAKKQELLKDRVALEVKRHLGSDFKRIGQATKMAQYAERIGREESCNLAVVLVAALLYDLKNEKDEGTAVTREILTALDTDESLVNEVCDLLDRIHVLRDEHGQDEKVLLDAVMLASIEAEHKESSLTLEELERRISDSFKTGSGMTLAREVLPVEEETL